MATPTIPAIPSIANIFGTLPAPLLTRLPLLEKNLTAQRVDPNITDVLSKVSIEFRLFEGTGDAVSKLIDSLTLTIPDVKILSFVPSAELPTPERSIVSYGVEAYDPPMAEDWMDIIGSARIICDAEGTPAEIRITFRAATDVHSLVSYEGVQIFDSATDPLGVLRVIPLVSA